ncbi:MAG TPA: hypothetical protein VFQ76_06545, partial [Longimicrobiaceae bacterium]|nr:hypothetical protein [Longimicrobiaceae bacterium]
MQSTRTLAAPALLLACTLTACVEQIPTSVLAPQALHPRERQILAQLDGLDYRGPVMITEQRGVDDLGEHPAVWTLGLPEDGMRLLANATAAGNPHAAALRSVLAAAETADPEQVDAGNNTPTSQLNAGNGIRPSSLACGRQSVMNMHTRLFTANWSTGQWELIQEADILATRLTPRANAAGHYHSGTTISAARVGTMVPEAGRMTGGVWDHDWQVPEFSQEFKLSLQARFAPPENPGTLVTAWFYVEEPYVSRYTGLVRIPPNEQFYDRVGGT